MSKTAIILGSNSDIAKGLMPMLESDGWSVYGAPRGAVYREWDLLLCCIGQIGPVGLWHDVNIDEWKRCVDTNLFQPYTQLRHTWRWHNAGATACLLAGSNPNMIMPGYSAYNVSKMALLKLVEQLDAETPDAKFFALGPGIILTKIHNATIKAGWKNPKLDAAIANGQNTQKKIARVYECLKWCIGQPKNVIGGRNICASDPWDTDGEKLADDLDLYDDLFKLQRSQAR